MAVGASFGYEHANSKAMDLWEEGEPTTSVHRYLFRT